MHTLTSITEFKGLNKKEMTNIRLSIPQEAEAGIISFQEAYQKLKGRKVSKEHVIWLMMDLAGKQLAEQAAELTSQAEAINA